MVYAILVGILASAPTRSVVVAREAAAEPVRVVCPVNRSTTIVFPEAMRRLKAPGGGAAFGLSVERMKPQGAIVVRPSVHPAQAIVEFLGPTTSIRVRLETAEDGEASEVRLVFAEAAGPETPAPVPPAPVEPAPSPSAPVASVPTPAPPSPPSPVPSASGSLLDLEGVLRARPMAIGRREGLPGQRAMVLLDALQGERWVWFRFALEGGARSRVARVSWERGEIASFVQEPSGQDLRIIVQVPRGDVTRKAHVSLEIEAGPSYSFALSTGSLGRFLKDLFQ